MLLGARQTMWGGGAAPAPTPAYWGLCFTAEQANSTVAMVAIGSAPSVNLLYSTDAVNWSPFVVGTTTVTLVSIGDKVWLKAGAGGNTQLASSQATNYNYFSLSGRLAASGNIMSLLNGEDATVSLANYAFANLFYLCSPLTSAPELPATILKNSCYYRMFLGCNLLTTAPDLPAPTQTTNCYAIMFSGCTSLSSIRVGLTTLNTRMSNGWLNNVAATGTFYCPTVLGTNETIRRGTNACPTGWTVVNTDA